MHLEGGRQRLAALAVRDGLQPPQPPLTARLRCLPRLQTIRPPHL